VSKDPLDIDGLRAIWVITVIWLLALIGELVGLVNLDREILGYGVLIGVITISYLTHRRYRRRQQR
jgi:hypothetical protein